MQKLHGAAFQCKFQHPQIHLLTLGTFWCSYVSQLCFHISFGPAWLFYLSDSSEALFVSNGLTSSHALCFGAPPGPAPVCFFFVVFLFFLEKMKHRTAIRQSELLLASGRLWKRGKRISDWHTWGRELLWSRANPPLKRRNVMLDSAEHFHS